MKYSEERKILMKHLNRCITEYAAALVVVAALLFSIPNWMRYITVYLIAVIFIMSVIAPFVTDWMPKGKVSMKGKAVLITGCDSGFGNMLARKLDGMGVQVFACCLFPVDEGAQTLKENCSSQLHIIGMDVRSKNEVQKAVNYVNGNLKGNELWAVVCNAGIGQISEILWTNTEMFVDVINTNTLGVVRVTKAFLPLIMKAKGRVIAIASAVGRCTYAGLVPYCMSKHGVVSFCEGLRMEMYKHGVQVVSVEPWMFTTPMTDSDNNIRSTMKIWESAPNEIKQMFGPDHGKEFVEFFTKSKLLSKSMSDQPEKVISCLLEAITSRYPKYSYCPGTLFYLLCQWIVLRLPKHIVNLLLFV